MQTYTNDFGLICIKNSSSDKFKQINVNIGNFKYIGDCNAVLVYHKGVFSIKNINEIGNGMSVFFYDKRKNIFVDSIDLFSFLMGISIYQDFDENEGLIKTYLYKFPKFDIEYINDVFEKYNLEIAANIENKFVVIKGEIPPVVSIERNIYEWIEKENYSSIFSFLYGLNLVYGKFDLKNGIFSSSVIQIPVSGPLLLKRKFLDDLFEFLKTKKFIFDFDIIIRDVGFIYQLSISDWEILSAFAVYIKPFENINYVVAAKNTEILKEKMKEYFSLNNIENKIDFENGTIKIIVN